MGKGYKIAIETLNEGRIGIGAQMVGRGRRAPSTTGSATRRSASSSASPSPSSRACSSCSRSSPREIEASRLLTYNAARLRDVGAPFIKEAAMAKLFASRAAEHVTPRR